MTNFFLRSAGEVIGSEKHCFFNLEHSLTKTILECLLLSCDRHSNKDNTLIIQFIWNLSVKFAKIALGPISIRQRNNNKTKIYDLIRLLGASGVIRQNNDDAFRQLESRPK